MKTRVIIIAISLLILFSLTGTSYALDARTGEIILIPSDEVIDEDLYLAGDTAIIEGTVNGDIWAACRDITVSGDVMGSVFSTSGNTTLLGRVKNGVKVMGGTLKIENQIGHDLFFFGNKLDITNNGIIGGDFFFGAREIIIDGPVMGNLKGGGQTVIINNRIGGDAKLWLQYLTLSNSAVIGGDLTYTSDEEALIQPGADIRGAVMHQIPEYRDRLKDIFPFLIIAGVVAKILNFVMTLLVGLVFILLFPRWINSLSDAIKKKPGASVGWGAVILVGTPIGVLIAFGTIVGLALGGVVLAALYIALYIGHIAISLCIGTLILGQITRIEKKGVIFGSFALGLFLITLPRFIPVLGNIVWVVASLFGVGSIVAALMIKKAEPGKKAK
ncbi:MAG: hypothetical protein JSV25_02155 [Spirochaetota bacterium]|nr:MAG: hypothetical protein JSV25_02155 [Spirochaetota bacterium]